LLGASADAIAFPVPTVQNKQDCPEDSGHLELRGSDHVASKAVQIAFKNGQASKLPIHSREVFKDAIILLE
jgi:hypothetical protein